MALDASADDFASEYAKDFSQILNSGQSRNDIKDAIRHFLQLSGSGAGVIKLSNYNRLSAIEEIEERRKKREKEGPYGAAYEASLTDLRDNIKIFQDFVSAQINAFAVILNKLAIGGALSAIELETLQHHYALLRNYGIALTELAAHANGLPTPSELSHLWLVFEELTQAFEIDRQKALDFAKSIFEGLKVGAQYIKEAIDYLSESVFNVLSRAF